MVTRDLLVCIIVIAAMTAVVVLGPSPARADESILVGDHVMKRLNMIYRPATVLHYSGTVTIVVHGQGTAPLNKDVVHVDATFEKPGSMVITYSKDGKPISSVICDGKTIYAYSALRNVYIQEALTDGTLDFGGPASSEVIRFMGPVSDAALLNEDIFLEGPLAAWDEFKQMDGVKLEVSATSVSGQPAKRVALVLQALTINMDFSEQSGLPGKISFIGSPLESGSFDVVETITSIDTETPASNTEFLWTPPAGAQRVYFKTGEPDAPASVPQALAK